MTELDIAKIASDIANDGAAAAIESWLTESWESPEIFHARTALFAGTRGGSPLKSKPGDSYDFYHDLVLRHLARRSEALLCWESGTGLRTATYDELHDASTRLSSTWQSAGVSAGACVAIVLHVGFEYTVAFLTALRMGLVVSVLPPIGPSFVANRLHALEPDFVVSHPGYAQLLGEYQQKTIPASGQLALNTESVRSHTYEAEDPVARLFSPLSRTPETPVERSAEAIYLPLMRDAAVLLLLRSGERLALPGFDPLQYQPWALMNTLLMGACYVAVEEKIFARAELAGALRPTLVGVTPTLRDRVLAGEVDTSAWRAWFLNPCEPYAWERWHDFSERLAAKQSPGFTLAVSAAFGGAFLFSPRRRKLQQLSLFPVPGQPWQLSDLGGSGEPTYSDSGVYTVLGDGAVEETVNHFVLSRARDGWVYAGSMELGRNGQTYPAAEIVAVIEAHPEVDAACIVVTPAAELLNKTRVILSVFIDPAKDPASTGAKLRPELERRIVSEMGARWLPDQVRFYPLVPRKIEGAVDASWCRWEIASGALDKKARDELFRLISALEKMVSTPADQGA